MRIPTPRQLPSGSWTVQVRQGGESYSFTGPDKDRVLAEAVAFKAGVVEKRKLPTTLGQAVDSYINSMDAVLSPSTVRGYRIIRRTRFQKYMSVPLAKMTRQLAQAMVNEEARTVAPKTVKNSWRLIASVLKSNDIYLGAIALPAVSRSVRPFLDVSQIDTFLSHIKGKPCEAGALLALHGLRRSELYALDWKQIDLDRGVITVSGAVVQSDDGFVRKETNKTQASARAVPIIIPRLAEVLRELQQESGPVVSTHPNTLYSQVNAVCREAGLPEVGVHGLRHSFASACWAAGVDLLTTAKLGGWSTSDLTTVRAVYTHLSNAQLEDGVEKLRRVFR